MDKEKALKILIANACCVNPLLKCADCPFFVDYEYKRCEDFTDKDLAEAVKVLNQ